MKSIMQKLNRSSFAKYGDVIEPQSDLLLPFEIVLEEKEATGWRIAVSRPGREPLELVVGHE